MTNIKPYYQWMQITDDNEIFHYCTFDDHIQPQFETEPEAEEFLVNEIVNKRFRLVWKEVTLMKFYRASYEDD